MRLVKRLRILLRQFEQEAAHGMLRALPRILLMMAMLGLAARSGDACLAQEKPQAGGFAGKVCAPSGEPLAGATVKLLRKDGVKFGEATSDSGGRFMLPAGEGVYTLRAAKTGWQAAPTNELQLQAGETKSVNLVMQPDATGELKLSDEPNFTVAGVTDWSEAGLHGSAADARTSEALSKETASLKSVTGATGPGGAGSSSSKEAETHRRAGDALEKKGDPVGAAHEYEQAARLDPSEENYFAWGVELLLHRASAAAIEVFTKAAREHPDSERMLTGLGAAYYANGQFSEAAQQICRASDLRPEEPEPYLLLGRMEEARGEIAPCSAEKLRRFVTQQPENAQANFYYGALLRKKGRGSEGGADSAKAEELLRKAVAIDPAFAEAYVQLGMALGARGDSAGALAAYRQAAQANPRLGTAHYQLSLALRRAGKTEEADRELRAYKEIERSEQAATEKEHHELRQFITVPKPQ